MNPQNNKNMKLDDLKRENPFRVPEHYFDALGEQITDRICEEGNKKAISQVRSIILRPVYIYSGSIAALLIIAFLAGTAILDKIETKPQSAVALNPAPVPGEYEIVAGIDEATLVEGLYNETVPVKDSTLNTLNKDKIINYLVEDNIEISAILEEF